LVLVNFTKGGTTPVVQVLEWNPDHQDAENNLVVLDPSQGAKCGADGLDACAITNDGGPAEAPWDYTPKSGPSGVFPEEAFFEGAINLSAFFNGGTVPCFASFMAESRSSSSVTAVLKDFVLDSFQNCEAGITLAANCNPTKLELVDGRIRIVVDYSGRVCNTSTGPADDLTDVTVMGPGSASPLPLEDDDGNPVTDLAGDACANFSHTYEPTTLNSMNPGTVTFTGQVTAEATGFDGEGIDATPVNLACPLCP
jgi:hypothetical protein